MTLTPTCRLTHLTCKWMNSHFNFRICGWNPMVWRFKWNLCGCTLAWMRILHGHAEIWNFSLSVEKYLTRSLRSLVKYFSTQEEKFCIFRRPSNVLFIINTNEIPNLFTFIVFCSKRCNLLCSHNNGDLFTCEDNMLFVRVKISCFHAKAHLLFRWCL